MTVKFKLGKKFSKLKKQNKLIMADLKDVLDKGQEVINKVDFLQETVNAERLEIEALKASNAQVVTDLTGQVATLTQEKKDLQDQIDANPSVDLQGALDLMGTSITKIDAATTDVAGLV